MSLRIPLTPDQTLQTEFHEIERRLRRLEKNIGVTAGPTILPVATGGPTTVVVAPTEVDLQSITERIEVLEQLVEQLGTQVIPVFTEVGPDATSGLVPSPEVSEPPDIVTDEVLHEDATWKFPLHGLVRVATDGVGAGLIEDVVNVHGSLHVAGDASVADIEVYNLHTGGDIEYTDSFFDDLRFPASGFNPAGSTAPPSVLTTNGLLSFSGTADNIIGGVAQMPHAWKEGTAVSPHIHVAFPTANPGTNTRWRLDYNIASVNGDFTTDTVSYTSLPVITVANANNIARAVLAEFQDIPMTGHTMSACILWRLTRLAASDGADDDTNACSLLEFDLHYEIDSPGSSAEYTK